MADLLYEPELDLAFREHLKRGEVRLQRCACGSFRYPFRFACPRCLSRDWSWEAIEGRGMVETFLWYCQPFDPRFAQVPYNVAMVRLAEGPCLFASIIDVTMDDLDIGQAVTAMILPDENRPKLAFARTNRHVFRD